MLTEMIEMRIIDTDNKNEINRKTVKKVLKEFNLNLNLTKKVLNLEFSNMNFNKCHIDKREKINPKTAEITTLKEYQFKGEYYELIICPDDANETVTYINDRAEAGGYDHNGIQTVDY